ncbi:MAG: S-layer homology domain-containing protein [Akkermansiaceae bacterium]|nr:S-layer homology domain-containing protein [Armatimonadota bacterium]
MKRTTLFAATVAAVCAVTISAPAFAQGSAFPDVPANHWAASSVSALVKAGIVNGYGASPLAIGAPDKKKPAYDGNKPVTRYELAVTLYRFVQHMDKVAKQPKSKTGAMVTPKTGADAVKQLVARGYLPANSPFVKNATAAGGIKPVTADEFARALGDVLTKVQETRTPVSKDSGLDIERPGGDTHTH